MDIRETPASVSIIDLICPVCNKGLMLYDTALEGNVIHMVFPRRYPHKCDNPECGHIDSYTEVYPNTKYNRTLSREEIIKEKL